MLKITKNQGSIQVTADKSGFYPFDGTITFPTNSLFTATSANTDMITFKSTSNGDVQFVGNYKDITISGRSYDTKQKFLTAFSNLANQGSVDAYTKTETDALLNAKQNTLTAGTGITIDENNVISSTGGSGGTVDAYTKAETDTKLEAKQDKLTAGTGITIDENNVISSTGGSGGSANPLVNVKGTNGSATIPDDVTDAVAIGSGASVTKKNGVAIGNGATSGSGGTNIAIGTLANSSGGTSIAIGKNAVTSNMNATAIGTNTSAGIHKSIAIGYGAKTSTNIPMVINAGGKTMFQGDGDGKISIPLGDGTTSTMCIQDEIAALKNAGGSGGGNVDAYTKAETDTKLDAKQDKLTAGSGITITKDETAGTSTIATAVSLTDNGNGAYTVGDSIKMGYGIAIGKNTDPSSSDSIAVGRAASTTGSSAIAIGTSSSVGGENSIAIGYNTINDGIYCVLIGDSSRMGELDDQGSVIIGSNANGTSGTTSTLIGFSASSSGFACTGIGPTARVDDTTPLVIKAGHKTVSDGEQILTMIQGDANGKISILLGDGTDTRMVISDEITALKAEITTLKAEIAALKGGA